MIETLSSHACFGGTQSFHRHASKVVGLPMRFAVYRPPDLVGPAPVLLFLAGLTATEETFAMKAGAQRFAAARGLMLVAPDTSPRETGFPDAKKDWDFGEGAGFYLDATEAPWSERFRMETYLVDELIDVLVEHFDADRARVSISGHSMGGHGALTLALRHKDVFRSVSAFAPIAAPGLCPWGQKAFTHYLGSDRDQWDAHDASALMRNSHCPFPRGILIDQGLDDKFLDEQLYPGMFEAACSQAGQPLTLRRHAGYDHGYYFIATFMADHVAFHADALGLAAQRAG